MTKRISNVDNATLYKRERARNPWLEACRALEASRFHPVTLQRLEGFGFQFVEWMEGRGCAVAVSDRFTWRDPDTKKKLHRIAVVKRYFDDTAPDWHARSELFSRYGSVPECAERSNKGAPYYDNRTNPLRFYWEGDRNWRYFDVSQAEWRDTLKFWRARTDRHTAEVMARKSVFRIAESVMRAESNDPYPVLGIAVEVYDALQAAIKDVDITDAYELETELDSVGSDSLFGIEVERGERDTYFLSCVADCISEALHGGR